MKHHPSTAIEEIRNLLSAFATSDSAINEPAGKPSPFRAGNGEDDGEEEPPPPPPDEEPPDEEPTQIPPDEEGWDEPPETWPDIPPSPVRDDPPLF